MTVAHHRPPLPATDVESVVEAVRERGLRVTAARRQLIEALFAAGEPVAADVLAGGLGGQRSPIDPASVYSNLQTLEELGLVRHVHLGHGPGLWMLADRDRTDFLYCERCGASRAVEAALLDDTRAAIRAATGYEARFTHFPIAGLCPECARAETESAG